MARGGGRGLRRATTASTSISLPRAGAAQPRGPGRRSLGGGRADAARAAGPGGGSRGRHDHPVAPLGRLLARRGDPTAGALVERRGGWRCGRGRRTGSRWPAARWSSWRGCAATPRGTGGGRAVAAAGVPGRAGAPARGGAAAPAPGRRGRRAVPALPGRLRGGDPGRLAGGGAVLGRAQPVRGGVGAGRGAGRADGVRRTAPAGRVRRDSHRRAGPAASRRPRAGRRAARAAALDPRQPGPAHRAAADRARPDRRGPDQPGDRRPAGAVAPHGRQPRDRAGLPARGGRPPRGGGDRRRARLDPGTAGRPGAGRPGGVGRSRWWEPAPARGRRPGSEAGSTSPRS